MHTIRRGGFVAGLPRACMSRRGRASETPAARRKVRRVSFMEKASGLVPPRGGTATSFRLEHFALHNLVDQRSESVMLLASFLRDRLDLGFVRRLRSSAGGVGKQLLGQGAGEQILVFEQQLLQLV